MIQIVILVALCFVVYKIVTSLRREKALKCRSCYHCKRLFDDGVICRYGSREVFKNQVHVENCQDYRRARG